MCGQLAHGRRYGVGDRGEEGTAVIETGAAVPAVVEAEQDG
ncbi:hypothetical protein ACFVY1_19700 [Streptomyces sp. NPDC058293]